MQMSYVMRGIAASQGLARREMRLSRFGTVVAIWLSVTALPTCVHEGRTGLMAHAHNHRESLGLA